MKSTVKVLGLLAILATAAPQLGFAKEPKAATTAPAEAAKPKQKLIPLYAQVESVTDTLLTVKGAGPDLKFVITPETKISKDKAHKEVAKATDAKPDQWVGGSYVKGEDGVNTLNSLHLGVSQAGPGVKKTKK